MTSDLADGGASEAAVNDDLDALEALYLDCALRFDRLIAAVEALR